VRVSCIVVNNHNCECHFRLGEMITTPDMLGHSYPDNAVAMTEYVIK
jgi:hypothetical protein